MTLPHGSGSIVAVGTEAGRAKGGISSALVGFRDSPPLRERGLSFLASHRDHKRLLTFLRAWSMIAKNGKPGDIYWFHCGPWLSLLRKATLGLTAKACGCQIVLHLHSPAIASYIESSLPRLLLGRLLSLADGIIVLTPWWQHTLLNAYPFLGDRIAVVPNVLDAMLEELAHQPRNPMLGSDSEVRVLAMARLVPEKGVRAAIQSLQHLPDNFTLTIAGDGPQLSSLRAEASFRGLHSRVRFVGWVDAETKLSLLRSSQVFCLPSRYDSFGMAFVEAMAAGLPVVALRQGAVPDVVLDNVTGVLLTDDTPELVASGIQTAFSRRDQMGPAAKAHVLAHFGSAAGGMTLLRFFDRVRESAHSQAP